MVLKNFFFYNNNNNNNNNTPCELLTIALADGLSMESKWQQIASELQDFSQYSGQS